MLWNLGYEFVDSRHRRCWGRILEEFHIFFHLWSHQFIAILTEDTKQKSPEILGFQQDNYLEPVRE